MENKMKTTIAVMFAGNASAQTLDGIVANGSCTPKVGDDVEVAVHTPRNNDPSIGQRSGVKYLLVTVIQGGQRAGTSIKGGRRTTLMYESDQKTLDALVKSLGGKGGAKIGMAKITKVDGSLQFGKRDKVKVTVGTGGNDTVTIVGKGSFVFKG
jgi:hypothetical protein